MASLDPHNVLIIIPRGSLDRLDPNMQRHQ